jgi:hypothetical protein
MGQHKQRVIVLTTLAVGIVLMTSSLQAQWPARALPGAPKGPDGTIALNAPAPRTADGKPELSGVWETIQGRRPATPAIAAEGTGELPPSGSIFGNVGDGIPGGAPYQPWAAELVKKRMADNSKDNPDAHCLPMGIMQMTSHPYPKKIIQTPTEVVMIYEGSGTTVREIFTDGRPLPPADAEPWWNGYSIGRWEGDTLVVETAGFMDDGWLDVRGSPLTSAGRMIERFRRPTYGSLVIDVTIDDPKAYTKPFTATITNRLLPDTQLIEFVCIDKSGPHYVGATPAKAQ